MKMTKKLQNAVKFGGLALILACANISVVLAEDATVETSPDGSLTVGSYERLELTAGETSEHTIPVSNTGEQKITYSVYASGYFFGDSEGDSETADVDDADTADPETLYTQLSRWITFQDDNGDWVESLTRTIASGASTALTYRVAVPESVPAGTQYAVIFFEPANDTGAKGEDATVEVALRLGSLVFADMAGGETVTAAEILSVDAPGFITAGNFHARATVENTGNTDVTAAYSLTIKSLFGGTLYNVDTVETFVFPETAQEIGTEWEETPLMGLFVETFTVTVNGETTKITQLIVKLPLFVLILLILALTLVVIWLIIRVKNFKRKRGASLERR